MRTQALSVIGYMIQDTGYMMNATLKVVMQGFLAQLYELYRGVFLASLLCSGASVAHQAEPLILLGSSA